MNVALGDFDDLVAFVLPGMVPLLGLSIFSPTVQKWFGNAQHRSTTLAGALLLIVTALGAGIVLDALRVQTVDRIQYLTGVEEVEFDSSAFNEAKLATFEKVIENYYVYSRFYGNLFVAVALAYAMRRRTLVFQRR